MHQPALSTSKLLKIAQRARTLSGSGRLPFHAYLSRLLVRRSDIEREAQLHAKKWPEYMGMTPLEATEEFARVYRQIGIEAYGSSLGKNTEEVRLINPELVANRPGEIVSLWRARQEADELGMPYGLFIEAVILGRVASDRWTRIPRPNQLLGKLTRPRAYGALKSAALIRYLSIASRNPRFQASNYCGHPDQNAMHAYIVGVVHDIGMREEVVAAFMGPDGLLDVELASRLFGSKIAQAAAELCTVARQARMEIDDFRPACLGFFPGPNRPECEHCPVRSQCRSLTRSARELVAREHGDEDPKAQHEREAAKFRKRRQRDRASVAAGGLPHYELKKMSRLP